MKAVRVQGWGAVLSRICERVGNLEQVEAVSKKARLVGREAMACGRGTGERPLGDGIEEMGERPRGLDFGILLMRDGLSPWGGNVRVSEVIAEREALLGQERSAVVVKEATKQGACQVGGDLSLFPDT